MKQLFDELLSWRHQIKKAQVDIAVELGVSQSTYHKWESEKCAIPLKYYVKITRMIGLDLEEYLPHEMRAILNRPCKEVQDKIRKLEIENETLLQALHRVMPLHSSQGVRGVWCRSANKKELDYR